MLSLHQPYATLVALGRKKIETRSWNTNYRGPVAIHATKTRVPDGELFSNDAIVEFLLEERYVLDGNGYLFWNDLKQLPRGQLIAVARLTESSMMGHRFRHDRRFNEDEEAFGFWAPERYRWTLDGVNQLVPGIPYKGSQGMPWLDEKQLHPRDIKRVQSAVYFT